MTAQDIINEVEKELEEKLFMNKIEKVNDLTLKKYSLMGIEIYN